MTSAATRRRQQQAAAAAENQTPTPSTARPAPEAPAIHGAEQSNRTVFVGCKMGIARLELQLCVMKTVMENTQTGPREIKQGTRTGKPWVIRGVAYPEGTVPKGFIRRADDASGYAITRDIPKSFMDEWMEQYAKSDMVKNGLIIVADSERELRAMAADLQNVRCAMQPLDMPSREGEKLDDRVPRSMMAGVGNIAKMDAAA